MIKMGKMLKDKSFWIILIVSIISLIALTIGVIFLTQKNEKKFYEAGYIINSTATKTDKYYFDENTSYKENVFEEYVFKNTDNKEVNTSKDNFIHYLDNSLSFMKNGVILDLDNFNEKIVPYYNITDKSIVKYNNGSYNVDTADKVLIFNNFLGRITDNKYIIVGKDIKIKLAGTEKSVMGKYFEILFVEDGIVKIENQEGSYQTVSEGTTILVGDNIKINLGDKTVLYENEKKLTLSEMTIDGNENIDIEPNDGKVKKENNKDTNKGEAQEENNNKENDNDKTQDSKNNEKDNNENKEINNTGKNVSGENVESVLKKEVSIDLVAAQIDANNLSASFQVIDTANYIKGKLMLKLVNTTTGTTVYTKELANVSDVQDINISSLSPDCNYLMTVTEDNNQESKQYFQKTFKTESLDLRLIREYVTTDSLSYSLDFGSNNDIKSANITLYDSNNQKVGSTYKITNGEDSNVTFDDLKNNTEYKVKVDSVVFKNTNYASIYTINTSDLTLKNKPTLGELSVEIDENGQDFTLKMTDPVDKDKSITKYTYEIYKAEDITEESMNDIKPVYSFSSEKLKEEKLKIGQNNLEGKVDYRYKVVVEYYDNYKYNEIETGFSNYFQVLGKPVVEFTEETIDFNQIIGTVKIKDDGCSIPLEGRSCFDKENKITIRYYGGKTTTRQPINNVNFDPETMEYKLNLSGLSENTLYTFEVFSDIDMHNGNGLEENQYIGSFTVVTKGIEALQMQNWKSNNYSFETPISVNTEMISTVPESDYGNKIASLTFNLYKGDAKNGIPTNPIGTFTETEGIKEKYYNKDFNLTSNMFGIENLDELRELSGGKLSRYYTIEVTDAYDLSGTNKFKILDNKYVFETPAMLLIEDEVSEPEIIVDEITNIQTKSGEYKEKYSISYDGKLGDEIIRGYKVTAIFDKAKIETYFQGNNPVTKLNFYATDSKGRKIKTNTIDLTKEENYTTYFFLNYGTDYDKEDTELRRGNGYKFSYDIKIDTNNDGEEDTSFPSNKPTSEKFISQKQDPSFRMYVENSDASTITYKYLIVDYDNALCKNKDTDKYYFTYKIDDYEEERLVEVEKSNEMKTFTLDNLANESLYTISYKRASSKEALPSSIKIGKYLFDGKYNSNDYNLGYKLEYIDFDNRLKIILDDNEFLNRVSAYLLTLKTNDDKYEKIYTTLSNCDEKKCIIIDYADISEFKGKDIKVSLEAFYDTGFIGFDQESKLTNYFKNINLIEDNKSYKAGFVYQMTNNQAKGQYINLTKTGAYELSSTPKGILAFELIPTTEVGKSYKLTTSNLLDISEKKFIPYGTIIREKADVNPTQNGIYDSNDKYTINPKVLDKANIQTDDNNFKFTSITPKVTTKVEALINGAKIKTTLSIDEATLSTDFIKTNGKYKFYIDIYQKNTCQEDDETCTEELQKVKTVETDYENIGEVEFEGLDPNSKYYYKISADMNKNGSKVKTPLFDYNRSGYVEYVNEFNTLNKDNLLSRVINYSYTSTSTEEKYTNRNLKLSTYLKTNKNFDIKYELYDTHDSENETLVFENTVPNVEITNVATYVRDITEDDLVYGNDYYTLKVYAVTTDLGKKLELFNDKLSSTGITGQNYHELNNPTITVSQESILSRDNDDNDVYSIEYKIYVNDPDRVIKNGIYHIELEDTTYNNACPGHEDDCKATINILTDGTNITKKFSNLKENTEYVIYIYADTYRNNISLSETEKNGQVYVRKNQFTKSNLGFSLGAVTPTATAKNKLVITFLGASNLDKKLKGIEYTIAEIGGEKLTSGKIGKTSISDTDNIVFKLDKDSYPTLEISMPNDKQLGENNTISITYYYLDKDNNLVILKNGTDTNYDYKVVSKIKS